MSTRQKPQPASGMGEALPHAPQPPQQLELPSIPLPPFAPRWPNMGTGDYTALELFIAGEFVTVERFRQLTESTRLPAAVGRLKKLGWPIDKVTVPEPSRRNRSRHVAVFHLPKKYIQQVPASAVQQAGVSV